MMNSTPLTLWPDEHPLQSLSRLEWFPAAQTEQPLPAVLICPGGGYQGLAPHEGEGYARWLNGIGFHAAVLTYRVGGSLPLHPGPFEDVSRALRVLRSSSADLGIGGIGVMGSSAGGHLAATLLVHYASAPRVVGDVTDAISCRPDFGILCYPVISMNSALAHEGSRRALLGPDPDPSLADWLSLEKQAGPQVPPCFVWHTAEDCGVSAANSLAFVGALLAAGVPVEFHLYEKGGHGLGLGTDAEGIPLPWTDACASWLARRAVPACQQPDSLSSKTASTNPSNI